MNFIDYNILNVSKRRCDVRAHHELRGDTWFQVCDSIIIIIYHPNKVFLYNLYSLYYISSYVMMTSLKQSVVFLKLRHV